MCKRYNDIEFKIGVLHFTGEAMSDTTTEKTISADITNEGDHPVVTITDWAYENFLPNGAKLDFYKQGE